MLALVMVALVINVHHTINEKFNTSISESINLQRIFSDFGVDTKNMVVSEKAIEGTTYARYEIMTNSNKSYVLFTDSNKFSCLLDGEDILLGMRPFVFDESIQKGRFLS